MSAGNLYGFCCCSFAFLRSTASAARPWWEVHDEPFTPYQNQGFVTFGNCADPELTVFRVNANVPLQQALEQASTLLYYAKKLALDAAMEEQGERYAWAAHFLAEMGKALIDDVGFFGGEGRLREGL